MRYIDISPVYRRTLWLSRTKGQRLTLDRVGRPLRTIHPVKNELLKTSRDLAHFLGDLRLLSLVRETDDRGTHAEKKGPLFYVDLDRSEEDRQGWGNPAQRAGTRSCEHAYVPVDRELTRTYRSRTTEQTRKFPLEVLREGVCPEEPKPPQVYIYRWARMGRKGQRCIVICRGTMNSCWVRFEDGHDAVTSRNALRKVK